MQSTSNAGQPPFRNELLAALPDDVADQMHRVSLVIDQVLHEVGNLLDSVYFVEADLVFLTANTGDTGLVEVGMTGREGLVGASVLLNPQAVAVHRALVLATRYYPRSGARSSTFPTHNSGLGSFW